MNEPITSPLILDLLQWIAEGKERPYEEVMEGWRTSCPRLPVWEDANDRGFLTTDGLRGVVKITPAGMEFLERRRPPKG